MFSYPQALPCMLDVVFIGCWLGFMHVSLSMAAMRNLYWFQLIENVCCWCTVEVGKEGVCAHCTRLCVHLKSLAVSDTIQQNSRREVYYIQDKGVNSVCFHLFPQANKMNAESLPWRIDLNPRAGQGTGLIPLQMTRMQEVYSSPTAEQRVCGDFPAQKRRDFPGGTWRFSGRRVSKCYFTSLWKVCFYCFNSVRRK